MCFMIPLMLAIGAVPLPQIALPATKRDVMRTPQLAFPGKPAPKLKTVPYAPGPRLRRVIETGVLP
jgi:hypothetical protein